jgi:hypothetical protein
MIPFPDYPRRWFFLLIPILFQLQLAAGQRTTSSRVDNPFDVKQLSFVQLNEQLESGRHSEVMDGLRQIAVDLTTLNKHVEQLKKDVAEMKSSSLKCNAEGEN